MQSLAAALDPPVAIPAAGVTAAAVGVCALLLRTGTAVTGAAAGLATTGTFVIGAAVGVVLMIWDAVLGGGMAKVCVVPEAGAVRSAVGAGTGAPRAVRPAAGAGVGAPKTGPVISG
jgi:hypothetical protein